MSLHHVVVVGGGFAGIQLVNSLKKLPVKITLIDRRNHHLFQPLLYQVATTILATSEIAWPIRHLYKNRPEVHTLLGDVVGIDRENRQVMTKDGHHIEYDTLVLATGARHAYFGKDEWEQFAPGLKTLEDATTIRRRLLLAFEQAEIETDLEKRKALMTFAIIGAGPTGVELAGIIAELAQKTLPKEFRNIDTREARVMLIEAGPRVLPVFQEDLSKYTEGALTKIGVEVMTGRPVTHCSADDIVVGDERIACKTILWAAGVQASKAAEWLGIESDRAGRAIVRGNLTIPDDDNIFVIGDTASVKDDKGRQVPGIAPAAKQQGEYAASVIRARLNGKNAPKPFRYMNMGSLATIGKNLAVIDFGKIKFTGWFAWWVWGIAHIYFLIGTRSRFQVAISWLWVFVSGQHSARLITQKETLKDD